MKKPWEKYCVFAIALMAMTGLGACSRDHNDQPASAPAFQANGGTGKTGVGGTGGEIYVQSSGSVKILTSGSVDASFTVTAPTPSFGANPAVISSGTTTVLLDGDAAAGNLCTITDSPDLYIGDGNAPCGDAGDTLVSGLTVNSGATLVLVDNLNTSIGWNAYGVLQMTNDLVINGTIKTNAASGLYIEANLIQVGTSGKITASATAADTSATRIYLGNGNSMTMTIINHGLIEAKGLGTGNGGFIYMEADDLVVNYGTVDTSGGTSDTGAGGHGATSSGSYAFEAYVDYGDFYSSGIVRMNGGNGGNGNGGDAGESWVGTANTDNTADSNGDIIISGTWEAKGGNGTNGNGGGRGYIGFETRAMGKVYVNATMSTKGGNGTGATSVGGSNYGVEFYSYNYGTVDVATPGKVRIAGHFDLRGGDGDLNGNYGGYLDVYSYGSTTAFQGTDVELIIPVALMSGGTGSANGGDASDWALEAYTYAPQYPHFWDTATNTTVPAGSIVNRANILAKGGNATGATGTGGIGGYVEMITNAGYSSVADTTTIVLNTGSIDISGGTGNTGGNTYGTVADGWDSLYLEAQNVTNTGTIKANGGAGTLQGGDGALITVNSLDVATPSVNTGTVQTLKGTGTTPGADGEQWVDGMLLWP